MTTLEPGTLVSVLTQTVQHNQDVDRITVVEEIVRQAKEKGMHKD